MQIQVLDGTGEVISGFQSAVSLRLPEGAGTFSARTLEITDGVTAPFYYTPGRISGKQPLTLDIPGIGILETSLTILP